MAVISDSDDFDETDRSLVCEGNVQVDMGVSN